VAAAPGLLAVVARLQQGVGRPTVPPGAVGLLQAQSQAALVSDLAPLHL